MAITIKPGEKVRAKITYRNTGQVEVIPSFRIPIRGAGTFGLPPTWVGDGADKWIKTAPIAPGQTKTLTTASKQTVPSDWGKGTVISARIDVKVDDSVKTEVAGSATAKQYKIPAPKPKAEWIKIIDVGWQ